MQQRLPSLLDPPIMFAHRGAKAHAPENTIEAFTLAQKLGATGLESDVWLTADGVAVLDHDGEFRRGVRRRYLRDLARDDLPSHIPSLAEMVEVCGTEHHLSLDLKDDRSGAVVIDVIRQIDREMLRRVWLCHPSLELLTDLRDVDTEVRLVNSTRLTRVSEGMERRAATLTERGIDGINLRKQDWNGGLVSLFHRFERTAFSWDNQHEHELRPAYRMGVDAVYSDHVDRMVDAFKTELGSPDTQPN